MCGFVGFHAPRNFPADADDLVREMRDLLRHRGPDDAGEWVRPLLGTALGFRRLAIVDRSELGHQPMASASGRFTLVVNGEVYNHLTLRRDLEREGSSFRGHSDSEVLLEAISEWGLETALRRSVGMFALALVDTRERRLFLARDRLGEKPLYYGWCNGNFLFGSELKAFRPHPDFTPEVDRTALTLYLRHGYVPAPHCILAGFSKLLPGCILSMRLDGTAAPGEETIERYWSIPKPGEKTPFKGSPEDYAAGLEELLRGTIRMQMLADVPVGAFLSGGTDSATVVSLMQAEASVPVKTFSIGFPDAALDESHYAAAIAKHLGTDHTPCRCTDSDVLGLAEQVPHAYSEPFADESQLPVLALSRVARRQVTVSLSGDGGDELFHYGRYLHTLTRWRRMNKYPRFRTGLGCGLSALSSIAGLLVDCAAKRRLLSQLNKARSQFLAQHLPAYYRHRMSVVKTPNLFLSKPETVRDFFDVSAQTDGLGERTSSLSYLDLNTYLPDHVLVKVDRGAMAFGLESRIPMLDHRIVEYAATAPDNLFRHDGLPKWPLRHIQARHIPPALTNRPKMAFCAPMGRWLRGPLRKWAEGHLAADRLRRENFFDAAEVRRCWGEHQLGKRDRAPLLWNLLVFQAWHASF
jgi:asparagine synthase (glutamine-hydrolysing)